MPTTKQHMTPEALNTRFLSEMLLATYARLPRQQRHSIEAAVQAKERAGSEGNTRINDMVDADNQLRQAVTNAIGSLPPVEHDDMVHHTIVACNRELNSDD